MSQKKEILDHLKKGKGISPQLALRKFGCFRLASRVRDLKDEGHTIYGKMVKHADSRFKLYYHESSPLVDIYGKNL